MDNSTISLLSATPLLGDLVQEIDPATCALLGPFALLVQATMGLLVIGSLLLKRAREKPKRRWSVWSADVSKQITGQAFVHASNLLISDLISRHAPHNPCSVYALNILLDTTLGLPVLYALLHLLTELFLRYSSTPEHYATGEYGTPFSMTIWTKQASVYVAALGLMKIAVTLLLWGLPRIAAFGDWSLSWLKDGEAKVLLVMGGFPIMMNIFQFYMIDTFLKATTTSVFSTPSQPLISSFIASSQSITATAAKLFQVASRSTSRSPRTGAGSRGRGRAMDDESRRGFLADDGSDLDEEEEEQREKARKELAHLIDRTSSPSPSTRHSAPTFPPSPHRLNTKPTAIALPPNDFHFDDDQFLTSPPHGDSDHMATGSNTSGNSGGSIRSRSGLSPVGDGPRTPDLGFSSTGRAVEFFGWGDGAYPPSSISPLSQSRAGGSGRDPSLVDGTPNGSAISPINPQERRGEDNV